MGAGALPSMATGRARWERGPTVAASRLSVVAAAPSRVSGRKNGDYGESELQRDSRQEFRRQGEETKMKVLDKIYEW
jgi:hypothetical protein